MGGFVLNRLLGLCFESTGSLTIFDHRVYYTPLAKSYFDAEYPSPPGSPRGLCPIIWPLSTHTLNTENNGAQLI